MKASFPVWVCAVALAMSPVLVLGQGQKSDQKSDAKSSASEKGEPAAPADVSTDASIDAGGKRIAYTAIAGTITVGGSDTQDAQIGLDGKPLPGTQLALAAPKEPADAAPVARMFYVAYFKKDAKAEERPITFFYNGGPGSSTAWLHMGSLGPKHVVTDGDQHLPAAPYKLIDNPYTLLDTSDLVFIDAPGTGFGRIMGKDAEKSFWGVDQDAGAFSCFIARFITKYSRWNSPKFLFGESYGTTRSAVVANMLGDNKSIDLNGVMLLSQIFNFNTFLDGANQNPGVDLPFVLALPT
jgi:carboxypeptidase C (cathepsin A)